MGNIVIVSQLYSYSVTPERSVNQALLGESKVCFHVLGRICENKLYTASTFSRRSCVKSDEYPQVMSLEHWLGLKTTH